MLYAKLIGAAVVAGIVYLGYSYVTGVIEDNKTQAINIKTLETAIKLKDAEIAGNKLAIVSLVKQNSDYLKTLNDAKLVEASKNKVIDDHDLKKLFNARPKTMKRLINKGTATVLTDIERLFNED